MHPRILPIAGLLALLLVGAGVYWQATEFGFVDYDDPVYVSEQPYVLAGLTPTSLRWALTDTTANIWHPLTWISHMLDVEMFGEEAGGHHFTSIVLHLASTACAYLLVLALFPRRWGVALFAAATFCLHPLHVESVAWVSERKDVLSGLLFHLSLLAYVAYAKTKPGGGSGRRALFYILALLAFALGLAAKSSILVLPGILVLIDLWPLRRAGFEKRRLSIPTILARQALEKLPFALLSVASAASGYYIQRGGTHSHWMDQEGHVDRLMSVPVHFAFYLKRSLLPTDLSFSYPRIPSSSFLGMISMREIWGIVGLLVLGGLGLLALRSWRRSPHILFGLGWALAVLSLFLGALYVGSSFTNDRYTYLALTGPAAALGIGVTGFCGRRGFPLAAPAIGLLLTGIWAGLSFQQTAVWRDNLSLFGQAVEAQPRDSAGWLNLGSTYERAGDFDAAIVHYQKVLEINPSDYITHHNLGQVYRERDGDWAKAMASYGKAIEIFPDYHPSLHNLGMSLAMAEHAETHDLPRAIQLVGHACETTGYRNILYVHNYVNLLASSRRFEEAAEANARALSFPHIPEELRRSLEGQREQLARILSTIR